MYDLIILGSGPAGLSAAVYASRAGLRFAVIEKEFMGTGQIAYTEQVDNYLGYCGIDGFSLGERFREHAEALGTEFIEGEAAEMAKEALTRPVGQHSDIEYVRKMEEDVLAFFVSGQL